MLQDIIVYIIVGAAFIYCILGLFRHFRASGKGDCNKEQSVFYVYVWLQVAQQASSSFDYFEFERKRTFSAGFL